MKDVLGIKEGSDIVALIGQYVKLENRGREWSGLCPLHEETTPSFYVSAEKGVWNCFGCGEGGDIIEFMECYHGVSFAAACDHLSSVASPRPRKPGAAIPAKPAWMSEVPPVGIHPTSFELPALGVPSSKYTYKSESGHVLGYVCRYVDAAGKKTFRQWTYGRIAGEKEPYWGVNHFSKPRPLYHLELLSRDRSRQVIIVEGEKAADAAGILFPSHVAVTWPGGAHGVKYVDWSPLYDRSVAIIPDHDAPGTAAAEYIASHLFSYGSRVTVIDPESDRPDGWDLADALHDKWSAVDALAWAKRRKRLYVPDKPLAPVLSIVKGKETEGVDALEPLNPAPPPYSDHVMALRAYASGGQDWHYVCERGEWVHWNGVYWKPDSTQAVQEWIRDVCCAAVNDEQGKLLPDSQQRALTSFRAQRSIENMMQCDQRIARSSGRFDIDPWVLATPAGTVDLKTGMLAVAKREDLQTQCTNVTPGGDCPLWDAFLLEIMDGDTDMVSYLQRLAGYCLTGSTSEEMLAFFYGTGANGKSVMLKTLHYVMGGYAATSSMDVFSEQEHAQHKNVLARLDKKRLVLAQETEEGKKWCESRIKGFTSGEMIQANFMRQNEFEFKPVMKLVFAGNHKPALRSVDQSIRRRVHIVPFSVTIAEGRRNKSLESQLRAEGGGILAWMIAGCLEWQTSGLCVPQRVVDATSEYLTDEDSLVEWLNSRCAVDRARHELVGALYKDYLLWCNISDEAYPWSKKRFCQSLYQRGMERHMDGYGGRHMRGIGLKFPPLSM